MSRNEIRIVPKSVDNSFQGFEIKGRRPENPLEWAHATLAMAHYFLQASLVSQEPTFLAVHDDPLQRFEDTLLTLPVIERGFVALDRNKFGLFALGGAVVRVEQEVAVGALLFPGIPHLGIGHTATVVHIDVEGQVHRIITDDNASTTIDPDIAVLSSVLVETL